MIETVAWVLPRPSKSKYIGSFPLHFERKLLNLLGANELYHDCGLPVKDDSLNENES